MRAFLRRWWPLLVWAAVFAVSSSTYVSTKDFVRWMTDHSPFHPTQEEFGAFWSRWWWVFVKGYHVLEFTVLFLLVLATLRRSRLADGASLLASFLAVTGYAALDEWHQTFVPLRGGRLTDVLIDLSGVALLASVMIVRTGSRGRAK